METDLTWMIGGPQGSGVESGANIFSQVCAEAGYHIFGKREFYSNIKGEHSYFAVRVTDDVTHSSTSGADLLAAFDAETIFRHYDDVHAGGGIIYDSELEQVGTERVHTLDGPFEERLHGRLDDSGAERTVAGALQCARNAGVSLYPVPFKEILAKLAERTGDPKLGGFVRLYNTIAVTLSLRLLGMPAAPLRNSVAKIFAKKPAVAGINVQAAMLAYDALGEYADAASLQAVRRLRGPGQREPHTILVQGYQGTALGKMAAGCRFQAYYPITPASDESVYMETHEILDVIDDRPGSTAVIQTEDEICAIGMTIGGTLTGTRSATCTSGPGFSLMNEALGWAGINEVPIVITDYQRSGPATGLPTRHGQDDLLSVIFAGHGEFPRIVYASGSVEESFYDTGRCFNYAEEFQVPLIHMMDKFLANTVQTCRRFDPQKVEIRRGKLLGETAGGRGDRRGGDGGEEEDAPAYHRFAFTEDGISPRAKLGMDDFIFWNTGDESDETGHITEDPILRTRMMEKRMSRLDLIRDRIPAEEQALEVTNGQAHGQDGGGVGGKGDDRAGGARPITAITWGSATGPARDAVEMLRRRDGIHARLIQVKLLHPFPAGRVAELLQSGGREEGRVVVDIEANYSGQLGTLLVQNLGLHADHYILKYSGRGMTCTEVYDALKKIADGTAGKREVLMYGA